MTYVVAIHNISDPDSFWSAADPSTELPPGVTLHATYPQPDGTRAVCLWEAESVDSVRQLVDQVSGSWSRNDYFEVDPQHVGTRGLPLGAVTGS